MTLAILVASWVALALLLRPPRPFLSKLGPVPQAVAGLAGGLCFVLIPISVASNVLSRAVWEMGGIGLRTCGRLVWAIVTHPLSRPELSISLASLTIVTVGVAYGSLSAWRSQSAARALARRGCGRLLVVESAEPFAFTCGLIRPRVVVSSGLLTATPPKLQAVVLAHEEVHRLGRHPLLLFVGETVARSLPLAPGRWASDALRFALELLADDRAARKVADRELVAEAVAEVALATVGAAPGFEGDEVRRVRRLLAPCRRSSVRGLVVGTALIGMLAFAGGHSAHCVANSLDLLATAQCRPH